MYAFISYLHTLDNMIIIYHKHEILVQLAICEKFVSQIFHTYGTLHISNSSGHNGLLSFMCEGK